MSVTPEIQVISPGENTLVSDVWELKETIRAETGFLQQKHDFFKDIYYKSTTYLLREDDVLLGFITLRDDGYILFLGVNPLYHGAGYGRKLIEYATDQFQSLSCHTRVSNTQAIEFYHHLGFETSHVIKQYYSNGSDAYFLIRETDRSDVWTQWEK